MSKPVKTLMIRDYRAKLEGVNDALVISIRGVNAKDNNRMRVALAKKKMKITVVRNTLARHAFKDSGLKELESLLAGPSAIAYGASVVDVAREVMEWAGKLTQLELKGAVLDGTVYAGKKGVEQLSKFPTRGEALSQTVTLILSPAKKVMGQVKGPGGKVMAIVKSVQEKLEKGETIAKAS
ncbi:MAG TPA: 50S ribosomal protein L10 [Phycisphaerales bacterium]|nr:50S ribosomal protein L10 [Phycisphaerales bacterium]